MTRWPVVPTLLVVLAAAAMVGLGVWQLERRQEKRALLAELAANPVKPAIAFPDPPVGDALLFRRATAMCDAARSFALEGAGKAGFRVIARCARDGGADAFLVQVGTTLDPDFKPRWAGGAVAGIISHAPSHVSLIARAFGAAPPAELLLVADRPAPGLAANAVPSLDSVPNNHLAYAVQWFVFAALALVIYAIALRRRRGEA